MNHYVITFYEVILLLFPKAFLQGHFFMPSLLLVDWAFSVSLHVETWSFAVDLFVGIVKGADT